MKRLKTILVSILTSLLCITPYKKYTDQKEETSQVTRKVDYKSNLFDEDILKEDFDEYDLKKEDNGDISINASKAFDISILEGIDFVDLDKTNETFTAKYIVNYDESEEEVFLTAKLIAENDIEVVDNIPGLFCNNLAGEPDVLFMVDDEQMWLSDIDSDSSIAETGWFSSLFKKIKTSVSSYFQNLGNTIVKLIKVVLKATAKTFCNVSYQLIGVHAFTNMRRNRFQFTVNSQDYIIWCWKGDYLNLGAGCELGVYKRWEYNQNFWKVDKSLAMPMTLDLKYKNSEIIDYKPSEKQWWITGFNSNYQDPNVDKLSAKFTVKFNTKGYSRDFDYKFYNAFCIWKNKPSSTKHYWNFDDSNLEISYSF